MNTKVKELIQEKYEVISRAADDCTYILIDNNNLTNEGLEHKLYTRLDRINSEAQNIGVILKRYFAPPKLDATENEKSTS